MSRPAQAFTAEERRQYLGASEIAAVMGLSKYDTPLDIYERKLGFALDAGENNHIRRGNKLEAVAADEYAEQAGCSLRRHTEAFVHAEMPYFHGHVDRLVVGEKRIVEIKAPSVAAFRRLQRDGLPESHVIQAQALMGLSGYPVLTWCIFCADIWDSAVFDVEFDATIYKAIETSVRDFWTRNVLAQVAPKADGKADIEIEVVGGLDITRRDDEGFRKAALALTEANQLKRDADALYDLAKKDILDSVEGLPGIYEGGGVRLYYTQQPGRVTLDKKAMQAAGIDLAKYEKHGNPFPTFRPYFGEREN